MPRRLSHRACPWRARRGRERCHYVCRAVRALGGLVEGASDATSSRVHVSSMHEMIIKQPELKNSGGSVISTENVAKLGSVDQTFGHMNSTREACPRARVERAGRCTFALRFSRSRASLVGVVARHDATCRACTPMHVYPSFLTFRAPLVGPYACATMPRVLVSSAHEDAS